MNITLFGISKNDMGGISRYAKNLSNNINSNYIEVYKKEIIKNNKKHFGYISSILHQPFYKIKSDIIHSLNGTNSYYKSDVVTIHDLYFDNTKYKYFVMGFLMPSIIRYKLHKLKIIVPSELVKQQFKKLYHSDYNLYVIPHGIDFNYINSLKLINPFETKNNIVIAGGVDLKRRNQIYLLDRLKNSPYETYVIGYGFMDILKQKYKNNSNLHFIKNPPDTLFYSYLKYSNLNLYNTIGEGFGYIIYESLYLGHKMLINKNPDNRLLFGNYANYYLENDYSLMHDIEYYFNKTTDFKRGLEKNYSIKNMVSKTLDVYNEKLY